MPRPDKITGGCLCGAIRYTINITPEIPWPPTRNGTCQCTMCRKHGGGLMQIGCTFPNSAIEPPLSSYPDFVQYSSSKEAYRGFCKTCGSSLTWNFKDGNETEILLGTVDEEILTSQVGSELCASKSHRWCANAVKGVTDNLPGEMIQN
ncbi:Mss4-like protein [Bisporella sp. PMI_857]|nr:Mss4-like protein [Bisporella sp. PMI_857]